MGTERTYGVLVRVYTPKAEEVESRVGRALEHARRILAVHEEFSALKRVVFLVPRDYDCGKTYQALLCGLKEGGLQSSVDIYAPPGYHSCEVLNEGLGELYGSVSHALIVSGKAMSYLTHSALLAIDQAFARGAKVSGLAIDELCDIVLAGRIQNTFAAWDINALLGVGGFDCRTDVEEMAPLVRLALQFGRCVAPIEVEGSSLDVPATATAQERHRRVMATKLEKQQAECRRLGACFEFIRGAIMA